MAKGYTRRAETTMALLAAIDRNEIPYAVLRNHENLHLNPGRDVDILVDDGDVERIDQLARQVRDKLGWETLVRCSNHHVGTSYYFLHQSQSKLEQLEMHFTKVLWGGVPLLEPSEVLKARIKQLNGVWSASDIHTGVQRLLQMGFSRKLSDIPSEHWNQIVQLSQSRPAELAVALATAIGSSEKASLIVGSLAQGGGSVSQDLLAARRQFILRHLLSPRSLAAFAIASVLKVTRRYRTARCGVVAQFTFPPAVGLEEELVAIVDCMFLNIEIVQSAPANWEPTKRVVERAGAVFVTNPGVAVPRSLRKTAILVDPAGGSAPAIRMIVSRFVENHELL